jgi:hypothetical protein
MSADTVPDGGRPEVPHPLVALAADGPLRHDAGGWWSHRPDLDVRATSWHLHELGLRLITITALPEPEDAYRVIYHWDAGDAVVSISTTVTDGTLPTLSDLLPAADWAEREIRDYYGLEFTGRAATATLMLREGDPAGLFTRTAGVGRDVDPARSALAAAGQPGPASRPASRPASGPASGPASDEEVPR